MIAENKVFNNLYNSLSLNHFLFLDVMLHSKKSKGLRVFIDEFLIRRLVLKLIKKYNEKDFVLSRNEIDKVLFLNVSSKIIKEVVADAECKYDVYLSDISFEDLIIHIALSVNRNNALVKDDILNYVPVLDKTIEYQMASYITTELSKECDIIVPENEIRYITLQLLGENKINNSISETTDWMYVQFLTADLIKKVGKVTGYNFLDDETLTDGLNNHLSTAIYRTLNNIELVHPFKDELQKKYKEVYSAVSKNLTLLEDYIDCRLNENEICFIALYFMVAVERKKVINSIPKVLVVCATGFGTAQLLTHRLLENLSIDIVETVSRHQLSKYAHILGELIIISTVDLGKDYQFVHVTPFITDDDIHKIKKRMNELGYYAVKKSKNSLTTFEKLMSIIDETTIIKDRRKLEVELLNVLNIKIEVGSTLLSEILIESRISLNENASDWKQAVRIGGGKLVESGIAKNEYVDAMIANVENEGPYVVITKGVALPHARPSEGVIDVGMSLIVLDNPVDFGESVNNPVKYVFCLAAMDSKSHIKALAELSEILEEEEFYNLLDNSKTSKEVVDYIVEYEGEM